MVEAEETTKSGIILTSGSQEKPQIAEVVEIGPGGIDENGKMFISKLYDSMQGWQDMRKEDMK